jgi:hypothetical protein
MASNRGPAAIILLSICLSACGTDNFRKQADKHFGDQHFKTTIALIELHKVREGHYPISLDSLKFIGDWDRMAFNHVRYKKLEDGYELDLTKGWIGKPGDLQYPADFWRGLGLKKSNLKKE